MEGLEFPQLKDWQQLMASTIVSERKNRVFTVHQDSLTVEMDVVTLLKEAGEEMRGVIQE